MNGTTKDNNTEREIKVRATTGMKRALQKLADERLTALSEIAREALVDYLLKRGFTKEQLRVNSLALQVVGMAEDQTKPSSEDGTAKPPEPKRRRRK